MRILISTLITAAVISITLPQATIAAENGQALELAPQESGPTLDETLRWLKQKIDSIKNVKQRHNNLVVTTSFNYDDKLFTIEATKNDRGSYSKTTYVCNFASLVGSRAACYTNIDSSLVITDTKCKFKNGYTDASDLCGKYDMNPSCYDAQDYKNDDAVVFGCTDEESCEKIAKAFTHAAKLIEKMPKKRSKSSGDLF